MNDNGPFVIVVAGVSQKVGKSTIASNLAVYLKALAEDLPVTLFSCEKSSNLDAMFALGNGRPGTVNELFQKEMLTSVAAFGQFGVCYLSAAAEPPQPDDPTRLRRILAGSDDQGVVVIDAGMEESALWRSAIWAADLVLVAVAEQKSLPLLQRIKTELVSGGGSTEMLWLLPSQLGGSAGPVRRNDKHQLLRFAADERGCQVLEQSLSEDQRVHLQAVGQNRPVLTRLPGSYVHEELRQLAEFVLAQFEAGPIVACRSRRLLSDGLLPQRARRVDMACPLCGRSAVAANVHYLEALPNRYRALLHENCLQLLLEGTSLHAFWPFVGQLLIRTGVEGRGLRNDVRLLLLDGGGELVEQQQLCPVSDSAWEKLLRKVTGRGLNEQEPGLLTVSAGGDAATLLGPARYQLYVKRRRQAFRKLRSREEL